MTGGTFANTTHLPGDFVINYGGSGGMTITGGTNDFAVVNAPNSAIIMKGGSNFYGQILGKTIDDQGGTRLLLGQVSGLAAAKHQSALRDQLARIELLASSVEHKVKEKLVREMIPWCSEQKSCVFLLAGRF